MKRSTPTKRLITVAVGLLAVAAIVGACSSTGSGSTQGVAGVTSAPLVTTAAPPAAGSGTVMAKSIGGQTILVAGSN